MAMACRIAVKTAETVRRVAAALVLATPFALAACGGGGSDVTTQQEIRSTTTGQELTDLKKAYDAGAISEKEYEQQRQVILNRAK